MAISVRYQQLVAQAMAVVKSYSVQEVMARLGDPAVQLVDVCDVRELAEGTVVGALHAPRGMLEFWVDPASPYFKPVFAEESKEFILFCGLGWRSALSARALQEMGMSAPRRAAPSKLAPQPVSA